MREKYETLKIADLRAIAKIRNIKGATSMSKGDIIEAMVKLDMEEEKSALRRRQSVTSRKRKPKRRNRKQRHRKLPREPVAPGRL